VSPDTLETLRTILSDRYRVERLLGSGGMATVYLAQDLKHDRPVAIKVLRPELAIALGPERFLREIQIAAKLTHPHILPLHDSGTAGSLLYYVMPYVQGESLLDRLTREKQLSVEEAVRIAREVAAALAYAHGRGIVHRDIKPGNILLTDGYAMVADFGLARAITRAQSSGSISQSGLTIGTPAYMSPEQAGGEAEIDGRSDLYALGCVLYELLAGDPPFTASNAAALLARHARAPVVPLRSIRASVPPAVEQAVLKALEKVPADRWQTAEEFAQALGTESVPSRARGLPKWVAYGALGVAALAVAVAVWRSVRAPGSTAAVAVDTTRYAVLPFEYAAELSTRVNERQVFQEALLGWTGVGLADRVKLDEALRRYQGRPLSRVEAGRLARQAGAGRYLRGEVTRSSDSLRLQVSLYDAGADRDPLYQAAAKLPLSLRGLDSSARRLTDQLLLREEVSRGTEVGATRSLPAWQAWLQGQHSFDSWRLDGADSAFTRAMGFDPQFARPALWLAVVRAWTGAQPAGWTAPLMFASARPTRLTARELHIAAALRAEAERARERACPEWRALAQADLGDFAAWFGLATCLRFDNVVVRDARSPSGWRFRSSLQEMVQAYRRAFELHPATQGPGARGRFSQVRNLLFTRSDQIKIGRTLPGGQTVLARAGWAGDTLVFIPYPEDAFRRGAPGTIPATRHEALLQQRRLLHELAVSWVSNSATNPVALEALAFSLELLDDPSALDTLRRARRLAGEPADQVRLAAAEVWFRLAIAAPDDTAGLRTARAVGDSLLKNSRPEDAAVLEGIAALFGRANLAAHLSGQVGIGGGGPEVRSLVQTAPALLAYAALGGPTDSIRRLEAAVTAAIEATTLEEEKVRTRQQWLERAARLAYADAPFEGLKRFARSGDPLLEAQAAMAEGRPAAARRYLADLPSQRRYLAPEERSPEALYVEARLFVLLGDKAAVPPWLDPMLGAVRRMDPEVVAKLANAATLVRAAALRAELASEAGDSATAGRWARFVTILWSSADDFLQPTVRAMQRLAGTSHPSPRRP